MVIDKASRFVSKHIGAAIKDIHGRKHLGGNNWRDYEWNELSYLQQVATLACITFFAIVMGIIFCMALCASAFVALLAVALLYLFVTEMTWLAVTVAGVIAALFIFPLLLRLKK